LPAVLSEAVRELARAALAHLIGSASLIASASVRSLFARMFLLIDAMQREDVLGRVDRDTDG
jgi:hypothetical protein